MALAVIGISGYSWITAVENSIPWDYYDEFENAYIPARNQYPKYKWRATGPDQTAVTTDYAASGTKGVRTRVNRSAYDEPHKLTPRAEFNLEGPYYKIQNIGEIWSMTWKMYIPFDFVPDPNGESNMQIKSLPDDCDTQNISTAIKLYQQQGTLTLVINHDAGNCTTTKVPVVNYHNIIDLQAHKGQWITMVLEYKYDPAGTDGGYVKFWSNVGTALPRRGDLLVDYKGAAGYQNRRGNYLKLGSYMYNWKNNDKVRNSRNAGVSERDYGWDDVGVMRGSVEGYLEE